MSLHAAAQHLKAQGRGPDDQLVHMSGKEVRSLQQLAAAHGGSLTVNPHTGLPEAGFLDSIMPTIIGAGVGIATGNPMLGAAAAGMYGYSQSGSLAQGLMAGLAGYGGAGLTAGVTPTELGFTSGAATSPGEIPTPTPTPAPAPAPAPTPAPTTPAFDATQPFANRVYTPDAISGVNPPPNNAVMNAMDAQDAAFNPNANLSKVSQVGPGGTFDKIKDNFMANKSLGLYAAAPVVANAMKPNTLTGVANPTGNQKQVAPYYKYNPGKATPTPVADPLGRENNYFPDAGYQQISLADANNLYGTRYADGGDVSSTPYSWVADQGDSVVRMAGGGDLSPLTEPKKGISAAVDPTSPENGISSAAVPTPTQTPVNGAGGAGPGDASGGTSSGGFTGSPTGNTALDVAYGVAGLGLVSPMAAAVAQGLVDAFSTTSVSNVDATNGLDVASDNATATGAPDSSSPAAGSPSASSSTDNGNGAGSDGDGGDGEARGGLSPHFQYHMANGGLSTAAPGFADGGMFSQVSSLMEQLKSQGAFGGSGQAKKYTYNPDNQQYSEDMAKGGLSDAHYNLGGYSDGGRLLKGPGDGVSDSIPAVIGHKQPARLADGEFVVPARIVSEIGNGSTEAGARKLYAMMDRVQKARRQTVGKNKVATNTKADKYLPA